MPGTGPWPRWPATWSPVGCGSPRTRPRRRTGPPVAARTLTGEGKRDTNGRSPRPSRRRCGRALSGTRVKLMDSQRLSATFVELADTLVGDFDALDFLHLLATRCTELLDLTAAGVLLADAAGDLRVMAASSEQ